MRIRDGRIWLVILALLGARSLSFADEAPRTFQTVDCDSSFSTDGELLFLSSQNGFIQDTKSRSYLQKAVPNEVAGTTIVPGQSSLQTIVVQRIPTEDLGFRRIEGGIPGQSLFVIAGGILGSLLAPAFRKNSVLWGLGGLMAGYLASIVIMDCVFEYCKNDMTLTVDNACDSVVTASIGSHDPVAIPAKSQLSFGIEEGDKQLVLRESGGEQRHESFVLSASKSRDSDGKPTPNGYVLNVFGQNSYHFEQAAYTQKR